MGLRVNFGKSQDSINRLLWLMGQNWLGQQSQARSMETIGKQMEGYRGLSEYQHGLELKRLEQVSAGTQKRFIEESRHLMSRMPVIERLESQYNLAISGKNPEKARGMMEQLEAARTEFAPVALKMVTAGDLDENDMQLLYKYAPGDAMRYAEEYGRQDRSKGELVEKRLQRGLESQKLGRDVYQDYVKSYTDMIEGAESYFEGLKDWDKAAQSSATMNEATSNFVITAFGDAKKAELVSLETAKKRGLAGTDLTPITRDRVMGQLGKMKMKINKGIRLSPDEESFLASVKNLTQTQYGYEISDVAGWQALFKQLLNQKIPEPLAAAMANAHYPSIANETNTQAQKYMRR